MSLPIDRMEPEVRDMAAGLNELVNKGFNVDAVSSVAPMITSAAISLKRIADELTTQRLERTPPPHENRWDTDLDDDVPF